MTRREMMTGIGLGAGALAGLGFLGVPLTAAAAPGTNHVAAWGHFPHALGPTIPNLTYVGVDSSAFHPYLTVPGRYLDEISGVGPQTTPNRLATPLLLEVGSVIRQINVCYQGSPIIEIFERDFANPQTWQPTLFQQTAPTVTGGGPQTHTFNLDTPITIEHGASYSLQFFASAGDSIYGMTIGYVPPAARFVPFAGSAPRVLDTRDGTGVKVGADEEITVDLGNSGVRGALLNLTVTDTEALGFAAVFDASISWPGNSSINWAAPGATVANGVVTAVASSGMVKIRVGGQPTARAHIIVDRLGWFV